LGLEFCGAIGSPLTGEDFMAPDNAQEFRGRAVFIEE
jgi:hypothetical protein